MKYGASFSQKSLEYSERHASDDELLFDRNVVIQSSFNAGPIKSAIFFLPPSSKASLEKSV